MNKISKPLKYIFNNYFHQTWRFIKHKFHSSIWDNVYHFLDCSDISKGYSAFKCSKCSHIHLSPFSCKSRFSPSYGKIYAENLALSLNDQLLDVAHVHATFSSPHGFCRDFFFFNRSKLSELAFAAQQAIKYTFNKLDILSFGLVLFILFLDPLIRILIFTVFLHMVDMINLTNGKILNLYLILL